MPTGLWLVVRGPWSAEERAKRLLLRHLSEDQKNTLKKKGYFDVIGSGGKRFRLLSYKLMGKLSYGPWVGVVEMWVNDRGNNYPYLTMRNIYVPANHYPTSIPPEGDQLLALKLALEVDENNVHKGCQTNLPTSLIDQYS